MAAAEARTVLQRTANRCFVQEDAKRAPKFACCPSSSSTPQRDTSSGNESNLTDHPASNFVPFNWNPANSNLPPDTKWWLQLQPSFGYQKDFTCEQMNALEEEVEEKCVDKFSPSSKIAGESLLGGPVDPDVKKNDCSLDPPFTASAAFLKSDSETRAEELKRVNIRSQQPLKRKADMVECIFQDEELLDWGPVKDLVSRKVEKDLDLETPWAGETKNAPWWRITDKDELALLVAQKSLQHIENCDLPSPTQTVQVGTDPFACLENLGSNRKLSSSLGQKLHASVCNPVDLFDHTFVSRRMDERYGAGFSEDNVSYDARKPYSGAHARHTAAKDSSEGRQAFGGDPSRAQLLDALRHSQTRAREAEIAAQKAYDEKEHIVKLLFKQASHLFAYKQWLHILQLESLGLQLKIKDHQISTLFPVLPWMPPREKPSKKDKKKEKKHKKCNICRYVVAFAVGLGLAGAGLLWGWTLGWWLPTFW